MSPRVFLASLAFLAFISLGLPDGVLGVAWPSISSEFGLPLDALGLLVAVTVGGYLTSSFLAGLILRLLPIGTILALSTGAAAIALLGFAFTPWWWLMITLGYIAGLGGGAVDSGLNAYGATHFSARTLNWLHAFFGVGTTVGPLIVTAVLGAGLEWRWSYAIVGSGQLLLAIIFFVTRQSWLRVPQIGGGEPVAPVVPAPLHATLGRPVVWLGMLVFFFYSGVELATAQWSYSILTVGRGLDATTAGLFVSLYWGSLTIGRVLFGFIADRVPLANTLRLCLAVAVVGAVLFWLNPSPYVALAGLMMIGFFFAPIFASLISLTPARVGATHADSAIGFQIASAGLGGAVLTALAGVLSRAYGLEIIGAAIAISAFILFLLYEVLMRVAPAVKKAPPAPPPPAALG